MRDPSFIINKCCLSLSIFRRLAVKACISLVGMGGYYCPETLRDGVIFFSIFCDGLGPSYIYYAPPLPL